MAHLREQHRVARERHRDRGHQLEALAVLGREQQRQERIARDLGADARRRSPPPRARARAPGTLSQIRHHQSAVDLHRVLLAEIGRAAYSTRHACSTTPHAGSCRPRARPEIPGRPQSVAAVLDPVLARDPERLALVGRHGRLQLSRARPRGESRRARARGARRRAGRPRRGVPAERRRHRRSRSSPHAARRALGRREPRARAAARRPTS